MRLGLLRVMSYICIPNVARYVPSRVSLLINAPPVDNDGLNGGTMVQRILCRDRWANFGRGLGVERTIAERFDRREMRLRAKKIENLLPREKKKEKKKQNWKKQIVSHGIPVAGR